MVTMRSVIAVVAHSGWPLYQMDVHNVFLQGDLNEDVYMTIPSDFSKDFARQGEYQLVGPSDGMSHDATLQDAREYQRLVGRLLYLTMTRLDISFVVQTLSQFMHTLKQSHMDVAISVVRYINSAHGQGLLLPAEENRELRAYCDADWGACLQTRRSVIGYLVFYGDALISWK
ncbi:uncharacterized mitochondrial protein AtMg00810-like [Nicotiana tomentosiformis]|uniref:uncharacterized mitochondrial protein AtMg00810-like n=1 Tax=Nicotiana tomentosiformis TaxID=4098 RepID=UPI000878CD04|nr:uncharacterized mitochondrial protein AtMg00810-like [Nicotiana tomentosiformis]